MEISIMLLVVLMLVLLTTALFVFNTRSKSFSSSISASESLDKAYVRAELVDFYLNQIIAKVGENATAEEFNAELGKYKDSSGYYVIPELVQAESKHFDFVFLEQKEGIKVEYLHVFEYQG